MHDCWTIITLASLCVLHISINWLNICMTIWLGSALSYEQNTSIPRKHDIVLSQVLKIWCINSTLLCHYQTHLTSMVARVWAATNEVGCLLLFPALWFCCSVLDTRYMIPLSEFWYLPPLSDYKSCSGCVREMANAWVAKWWNISIHIFCYHLNKATIDYFLAVWCISCRTLRTKNCVINSFSMK